MVYMSRVNVAWQNFPGAPGLTQFFLDDATSGQTHIDAIRTFFDAIKALLPTGTTIQVPSSGDRINEADGSIQGTWSVATTPALVTCTGAGAYAGNAGMCVHWLTATIVRGRRLRGRTFLVPTVATAFDTNGTPTATALTTLNTAASALLTSMGSVMQVWSRPQKATPEHAAYVGSRGNVTGFRVPDLAVSLRSRRV